MSVHYLVDPLDVMTLAHQGKTAREAADTLGVALNTVHRHAAEMGVRFRRDPHPNRTPDHVRARVDELRAAGVPQAQIARDIGRSPSWVAMYLRGER